MHGFPYNWEDYAASCRVKESTHADTSGTTSTSNETNKFLGSLSLNDLPATAINDHLRSTFGHSSRDLIIENNICSNLSTSGNSEHSKAREDPKPKNSCSVVDKASTANATRVIQKKAKSESRQRPSREDVPAKQCRVTRSMSKRNSSLRVLWNDWLHPYFHLSSRKIIVFATQVTLLLILVSVVNFLIRLLYVKLLYRIRNS